MHAAILPVPQDDKLQMASCTATDLPSVAAQVELKLGLGADTQLKAAVSYCAGQVPSPSGCLALQQSCSLRVCVPDVRA